MTELREQLQQSLGNAYTISREIGGGGMARVFVAVENRLHREVVVKVLSPDLAAGISASRFEREIQLAAQLQQANIVPLLSAGETSGLPYFTMPFVEGESLRARLANKGALPIPECIGIMRDVARALSYAHAHGVVHRDIKPDNVLLSHGTAVVTDFGIAKAISDARTLHGESTLTQVGTSIGTPAYMSPEQAAGDPEVDHRSDIYAFGCLSYELLTGQPVFASTTPQRVLAAHLTEKPRRVSDLRRGVPQLLATLVMSCLEKNPGDRPASADQIVGALNSPSITSGSFSIGTRMTGGFARRWIIGAALLLGLAGMTAALFAWRSSTNTLADKSIAVLPLTNLSGDKSNDYFGEGLAEEITGSLARAGLRVIGRNSAQSLSARGFSATEIARQLGVAHVLMGSVQRAGDRVRISVSLMSAPDGSIRWNERYDRSIADIFAVQDEIARTVANELRVTLSPGASGRVARHDTNNPQAHSLYLRAQYLWNRRTGETLTQAIDLFGQAVRLDSTYARAYGGIAMAYVLMPAYADVPNDEMISRARTAARRALALDSTIVEAHTALAYADVLEYRNEVAEKSFARAIALDPGFATAHFWYALLLNHFARFDEAIREIEKARELEPASIVINNAVAQIYYTARRYPEAEKEVALALSLDPNFQLGLIAKAVIYIETGRANAAVTILRNIENVPGIRRSEKLGVLALALARAGRRDEAREVIRTVMNNRSKGLSESGALATAMDALGDREGALQVLRAAMLQHDLWLGHYNRAAPYDGLRSDPRAAEMFRAMGQ